MGHVIGLASTKMVKSWKLQNLKKNEVMLLFLAQWKFHQHGYRFTGIRHIDMSKHVIECIAIYDSNTDTLSIKVEPNGTSIPLCRTL